MNEASITKEYSSCGDNQLIGRGTNVFTKMSLNADKFPAPPVALRDLEQTLDTFRTKVTEAEYGDRQKAAEKNAVGDILRGMLSQLDKYVTEIGKGDPVIYFAAGFAVKMGPEPNSDLEPVEDIKVILGQNSGTVKITCSPVDNAVGYTFQYAIVGADGNLVWQSKFNTKAKIEIQDLVPGKEYYFRIIAHCTNDRESYSETIKRMIA
ncbi:MAG: fibronectin type III domain-containing protein [Chitinophagaceae bacterium]